MSDQPPTASPSAPPVPASTPSDTEVRAVEVELEFRHSHHIPDSAEYPSDESLKTKLEENLVPGMFRVYVKRKQPKEIPINIITLKGISSSHVGASNLDPQELERVILSIGYRHLQEETKERTSFLVEFQHKPAVSGQRPKTRGVTFWLDPHEQEAHDYKSEGREPSSPDDEARRREDARRNEPFADPPPRSAFQEEHSPFPGPSQTRPRSWRDSIFQSASDPSGSSHHRGDDHRRDDRHRDDDRRRDDRYRDDDRDDDRQRDEDSLAVRRAQLFSPDQILGTSAVPGSPEAEYAQNILPFAMINSSMGVSYKAFASAIDMLSTASREQARLHATQMQTTIDRERELMKLPLKFLEIEANNKGHHADLLHQSQKNYLDALRMRGEMSERELGYERQNMHSQFQLTEVNRTLGEQQEKHQREQGETFRRDLLRGIGPMALQGLGLFLDYFGQQKLGAAAKMSSSVVEGIMQSVEQQQGGPGAGAPASPPGPQVPGAPGFVPPPSSPAPGNWPQPQPSDQPDMVDVAANVPGQTAPSSPTIPRRSVRLLDVATAEEIQMQPLRSLCRMADAAFSAADRQGIQQILDPQDWVKLEQALRAASDQECLQGLGMAMFAIGQDPERYGRMMEALAPGQRELLHMIGDVMQGKIPQLDPNYEVRVRPPISRMRTVLQPDAVPSGAAAPPVDDRAPVPPPDLDSPADIAPVSEDVPRPSAAADTAPVPEDVPRPSMPTNDVPADAPEPTGETADPSLQQQVLDQLQSMQGQLEQMREEGADRDERLRAVQTKVEQTTKKKAPRARQSRKKKPAATRSKKPSKRG